MIDHFRSTDVLIALVVVVAGVAVPVAGHEPAATDPSTVASVEDPAAGASPSLVVELRADGSATVTLTETYDLETDDERAAFRSLRNDSEARENATRRFADRMRDVAADASAATGREMSVSDPTIDLSTADDGATGVVTLSVSWTNLAAESDGQLVVTEPFASGFQTDRRFTVVAPDGYELVGAEPAPDATDDGRATWNAGTDLSGFEVTVRPAEGGAVDAPGGTAAPVGESTPGFGVATALIALLAVGLLVRRR